MNQYHEVAIIARMGLTVFMGSGEVVERVRSLLEESGLSKKDYAQRIGIDGSKLTKSLSGKRRFTSLELALIADQGATTVDWLLGGSGSREVVLARRASEHAFEAGDLVGRAAINLLIERAEGLEFLDRSLEPRALPAPSRSGGWLQRATSLAATYSQMLGANVGELSTSDLTDEVESLFGIHVVVIDLPDGCDGLSFSDGDLRAVVLATSDAPYRQRFTLAHELGHIAFGDAHESVIEERLYSSTTMTERRANAFAAHFLAPRPEIDRIMGGRSAAESFADLVLELQMSPEAMSWRLFNEHLVGEDERARLGRGTARTIAMRAGRAAEHTERARHAQILRPAQLLVDAYLEAYRDGITTLRPAASLLGRSADELEAYFVDAASADDASAFDATP